MPNPKSRGIPELSREAEMIIRPSVIVMLRDYAMELAAPWDQNMLELIDRFIEFIPTDHNMELFNRWADLLVSLMENSA